MSCIITFAVKVETLGANPRNKLVQHQVSGFRHATCYALVRCTAATSVQNCLDTSPTSAFQEQGMEQGVDLVDETRPPGTYCRWRADVEGHRSVRTCRFQDGGQFGIELSTFVRIFRFFCVLLIMPFRTVSRQPPD